MKKVFFISLSFILATFVKLSAQESTITMNAECGKIVESEFSTNYEAQDVKVRMGAGDVLEFNIFPVGNYLKVTAALIDPSSTIIINQSETSSMYSTNSKSLVVKSQTLSASGVYIIRVYNHHSTAYGNAGAFSVHVKCTKRNGDVIEPK